MVPKVLAQDPPEIGLGTPVWRSVVVGQIEMGDAKVECSPHDGALSLERSVVAEILPKPERYGGEKQTAAPTTAVGHGPVAILSGIVDSHRHPHIRRMIWLASRAGNSPRSIHSRWPRARVIRTGHPFEHSSRFRFLGGAHGPSSRDIRCLQRPLQPGSRNQFQCRSRPRRFLVEGSATQLVGMCCELQTNGLWRPTYPGLRRSPGRDLRLRPWWRCGAPATGISSRARHLRAEPAKVPRGILDHDSR